MAVPAVPAGATRMHVPLEQRHDFDQAINAHGRAGPRYRIAIEGDGLTITGPDGDTDTAFEVDGHLAWARPSGPTACSRPVEVMLSLWTAHGYDDQRS